MGSAYTPGPWEVAGNNGTRIEVRAADGTWVADARPWTLNARGQAEQEANAALISAAPDMALALAMADETLAYEGHSDSSTARKAIRQALAKAEGR